MESTTIQQLCTFLDDFAPPKLAEEWDNVGLLVGDRKRAVARVMTCLTVTPDSVAEAVDQQADCIVTHHPLPFRALKRITTDTVPGMLLWKLIRAGIAVYSPHTAFDSAAVGINQTLAEGVGLTDIQPLIPAEEHQGVGTGRMGRFESARTLGDLANRLKEFLGIEHLKAVGNLAAPGEKVAVACGSAGQFLGPARAKCCDALVTGETTFHTCLEAEATEVGLVLPGHYASERFAVERLAEVVSQEFPHMTTWACAAEHDPVIWL